MSRIAVIEDAEASRLLIVKVLSHAGHEVFAAGTAEDGIALVRDAAPDLVLMDLSLPGVDGIQALRRLRQSEPTRGIPVIALTAHAMADDRAAALQAGFDHYIPKPIDVASLPREIEPFLRPF